MADAFSTRELEATSTSSSPKWWRTRARECREGFLIDSELEIGPNMCINCEFVR